MQNFVYPAVRRAATEYVLHGRTISDPYQWLEDPAAEDCKGFVTAQNALFESYLEDRKDTRAKMLERISALQNNPRTSTVSLRKGYYYYYHNTGLLNQSVLKRATSIEVGAEESVFLDPNTLSADGTTALKSTAWNDSETLWAYSVSEKGSDWQRIHIRDATTLQDLNDTIEWVKFSGISWWKDEGFFYTRYPPLAEGQEKGAETDTALDAAIYFHKVGTAQADDIFILSIPEHRTWSLGAEVTDCNSYVLVSIHDGCERKSLIWIASVPESGPAANMSFAKVVNEWIADYSYISNDGELFYFTSTKDAPKTKVIGVNISTMGEVTLVGEKASVLNFAAIVGDTLLLAYLEDVKDVAYFASLAAPESLTKIPLPIGSIDAISCNRKKPMVSVKISSFLLPGRSYIFDIADPIGTLKVFRDDVIEGFDADEYDTKQIFYSSHDGANIPMFILFKKGIPLDGSNPLLVYGYGGFNISLTPSFSASRIAFLGNLKGVVAIPNIRGGGEYGQAWYDAGRRQHKQNCFSDFIAGIKYLHAEGYGSPATTAIMGGSNGGLLVAATANQAPELLSSVVCQVGVLDMYKFHKFTIGHAWRSDYGDPDVEEDFVVLQKYSPIHNVREGVKYPAVLVVTGDHDDRVVPLHSLKYTATLQHTNPSIGGPFLARVEVSAGHGAGKPTAKRMQEAADTYAFIAKSLGLNWYE